MDVYLVDLPAGEELHRFYTAKREPIFLDTSPDGRFNAPNGSYGVLYAAHERTGAFAETFLRTPGGTLVDNDLFRRKAYVCLTSTRKMTLIRLGGSGLARLGATAEVIHGGLLRRSASLVGRSSRTPDRRRRHRLPCPARRLSTLLRALRPIGWCD